MKRRIIAALTALVMVVTMIPASAFAATSNSVDAVKSIIEAVGLSDKDKNFDYENHVYIEDAHKIVIGLTTDEKTELGENNIALIEAAYSAVANFNENTKEFKDNMKVVAAGPLSSNSNYSKIEEEEYTKALDAYNNVVNGEIEGKDKVTGISVKINAIKDADELDDLLTANYVKLITTLSKNVNYFLYFTYHAQRLDEYTDAQIADADPVKGEFADSNMEDAYKEAKPWYETNKTVTGYDVYLYLAKGYDKFMTLYAKENAGSVLDGKINKITEKFKTGNSLTNIKNMAEEVDKTAYNEFVKALDDAKALIDSTKDTSIASDWEGFVKSYKDTKELYDKYLNRGEVEAAIKQLPSKSKIDAMKYDELFAAYKQYKAIPSDVATELMNATVKKIYDDTLINLNNAMAKFNVNTIAEDYAAKLSVAINKISKVPGRNDLANIDAVIDLFAEYRTVLDGTTNAQFKVEAGYVNHIKTAEDVKNLKLSNDTVFQLEDNNTTLNILNNASALYAKMPKGSVEKFNNAYNYIKVVANVNADKLRELAGKISDASGNAVITESYIATNGIEKAEKLVKEYKDGYAALDATLKADFDKAMTDKDPEQIQFYKFKDNLEAAEKLIAENASVADEILAGKIIAKLVGFNAGFDGNKAKLETEYYNKVAAEIKALETEMAKPSVKALVMKSDAGKAFTKICSIMENIAADKNAPTAVINAIEALKVIDPEKETVTKDMIDATVAAYEAADKAYKALTPAEQARVTNVSKLAAVKTGIIGGIKKLVAYEITKIGPVDTDNNIPLTDAQKAIVNGITVMKEQYKEYVPSDDFENIDGYATYKNALANMEDEIKDEAGKEFATVLPMIQDVFVKYYISDNFKVDKTSAVAIINAVDKYNALSDEAKKYAKDNNYYTNYAIEKLIIVADFAKTLVLDYATVEVKDVEFDGTPATPAVVVKDFHGNTIEAKEFTVSYSNNEKPGTAKAIVTAKADGKYVGTVTKEFKVIAKELAKVENVKFDTDYGIVRVIFDRTADIEGIDVRYQVQYKKTTSDKWITKYPTKGYEYLTLRNLTKNGKYDVRVRAYTDDYGTERVYGEYSDVKEVYANRNGAKSGIMYKAVIKSLSTKSSSVTMTVNPVKYQTIPQGVTWTFSCKKYGSQYTTWTTKTTKSTTATFKNLKKGTKYVVRAQYSYTSAVDGKTTVKSNFSTYKYIVVK